MRTNMTKASMIAIALISGVLLGTSVTLMASADCKGRQAAFELCNAAGNPQRG
jgi:hypothetical protein